ncbi:hypothetical protein AVEN_12724-1 [Araneus ventricosus]|uniref:Uncharacterized protein n=1 Tax=Araneus ventricosus TaxID=182803 RepID=A0A4Y2ACN6_ARAVE|nr:hypothetical protein AVEN_12724-1 [Araneus ventricosus]
MVPTRRRPSAQGIKCPTVHSEHIPATSHRVCCVDGLHVHPDLNPWTFFWGYIKHECMQLSTSIAGTETHMDAAACHLPCCTCELEVQSSVRWVLLLKDTIFDR